MLSRIFSRHRQTEWKDHINPDGSRGGMVARTAVIDPGVYIPVSAVVLPGVHVSAETIVEDGALITSDGAVRFGPN